MSSNESLSPRVASAPFTRNAARPSMSLIVKLLPSETRSCFSTYCMRPETGWLSNSGLPTPSVANASVRFPRAAVVVSRFLPADVEPRKDHSEKRTGLSRIARWRPSLAGGPKDGAEYIGARTQRQGENCNLGVLSERRVDRIEASRS